MEEDIFKAKRKSYMEPGEIFFWTASINKWLMLLEKENYKKIVLNSLQHLSNEGKIDIFGFVIMPNHIHLIWRTNGLNGKETPQGSFLKYTAHEFKKELLKDGDALLSDYLIKASNKKYEFWQRDPLAIHLYTKEVAFQKLDYVHNNPATSHWQLVSDPCDYRYSSAKYYETDIKNYAFLKDIRDEF